MAFLKTLLSCLAVVLVLFSASEAREFVVGKEKSWKVPSDSHNSFNAWASRQRFLKGDHLVFQYDGKADSVMEVNRDGYLNCDAHKPLRAYDDNGYTTVELNGAGPFYFISGNADNCEKGEKLEVILVNERHHHGHHGGHIAPAPAPSTTTTTQTPAPAPANGSNSLKNGFMGIALVFGFGFGFWL